VTDDAPRWFDDDTQPPSGSRRLPTLLVAAVVPWLVLAVVLVRGAAAPTGPEGALGAGVTPTSDEDPHHHQDAPTVGSPPPGSAVPPAPAPHDDHAPGPDHTSAHGSDDDHGAVPSAPLADDAHLDRRVPADHPTRVAQGVAEALVLAITRAWLSDAGPDLDVPGIEVDRRGYLEHVAVERITLEGDSLAVATVTVVVLDRDGDRYGGASVRRAAVPLRVTETTVHPAGQPWWLPDALDLTPQPPEATAVDDEAVTLAVAEALDAAGYRDPSVDELAVVDGGTVLASVTASVAGGVPVRSDVWLRLETDGTAAVLGHHEDDTTGPARPTPRTGDVP
jgi:hypothetical protein